MLECLIRRFTSTIPSRRVWSSAANGLRSAVGERTVSNLSPWGHVHNLVRDHASATDKGIANREHLTRSEMLPAESKCGQISRCWRRRSFGNSYQQRAHLLVREPLPGRKKKHLFWDLVEIFLQCFFIAARIDQTETSTIRPLFPNR